MFKYDQFGNQVSDNYHYIKNQILINRRKILSYNAATNTIGLLYNDLEVVTEDSYAIANHVGCFSQVGQYIVNDNLVSISLSQDPTISKTLLEVSALDNDIKLNGMEGINLQGLLVRKCEDNGISGYDCSNLVSNCSAKYNSGTGISLSYSSNLLVDGGEVSQNYNNGVAFEGITKDSTIQNVYSHLNANNGIWVGNSGGILFYCTNILLKSNKVGPHNSERLHPDNVQIASCDNITLESNILTQQGFQNMWSDKNGLVIYKRNIISGGPLGVNNAQSVLMKHTIAYPYWLAIIKRELIDSITGKLTNNLDNTIYEVTSLTRAILDEVFDRIISKGASTFYPRNVAIKNNAFIESFLDLPPTSLLPYWETDFNYIEQPASYHVNIWRALVGPNTILETSLKNTTLYFKNITALDFNLNCNSNITLIDKGTNVGLPYYGKSPDIGAYEANYNNELNPSNPIKPNPSDSTYPQISTIISTKPIGSRVVSSAGILDWKVFYSMLGLIITLIML